MAVGLARVAGASLLAYSINLPWRIWWGVKHLPVTLPTMGATGLLHHIGRLWPSLWLILRLTFAYEHWLAFVPLAIFAALASIMLRGQPRETAVMFLVALVGLIAGFTYVLWDDLTYVLDTHQASTPMPRAVGSIVILATVLAPLLIEPLVRRPSPQRQLGATVGQPLVRAAATRRSS